MKKFRRIICIALVLISLIQLMTGCAVKKTDEAYYLSRGEFFAYFVHENNMTSNRYSAEEINACADGSVEAEILVDWGYLTEKQANVSLKKSVDKETVVTVCANATFDLKEGNISDIKDAKLLDDPQLIADAYASGFFDLENGYFDGAKKMTLAECEEICGKADKYTAETHYDPEDNKLEMTDDVHVYEGTNYTDGDIQIEFHTSSAANADLAKADLLSVETAGNDTGISLLRTEVDSDSKLKNLHETATNDNDLQVKKLNSSYEFANNVTGFSADIRKGIFEEEMKNPKVGEMVVFSKFNPVGTFSTLYMNNNISNDKIIGILRTVELKGNMYQCNFDYPNFEEATGKIKDNNKTNARGIDKINFKEELNEYKGWKLTFNVSGNAIQIQAKKPFTIYETGRKQDWQNAKKTINATVDFSISDFQIDTKNIKSFATKKDSGFIKITWDTDMSFKLDTSLRYTPDSNRNGKFPSNWTNSRLTDWDSKGAEEIKVARFNPSLYGIVGAEVYIYLKISVDGKISFRTSVDDGGVIIRNCNGQVCADKLGNKDITADAQLNMYGRFGVDATIKLFKFINVIEYDVGFDAEGTAMAHVFYKEQLELSGVFADEEGLNELVQKDKEFGYCVGISLELSASGQLKKSGVKLILDCLSKGNSLDFEKEIGSLIYHIEDGKLVPECTRGLGKDELKTSDNNDIELETYKINLDIGQCTKVSLEAIPSASKVWKKSRNAITVKSKDKNIAKATYDKSSKSIIVEAVDEGSTEIVITARTGILFWKKNVEQEVSVTVNAGSVPISAEGGNEVLSQIQIVYL